MEDNSKWHSLECLTVCKCCASLHGSENIVTGKSHSGSKTVYNKTDNVSITLTLRCICATVVAVEKEKVLHILSVCLTYPTCNVHVLYCHLRPVWHCNIFPHYLINGTIKKKIKKLLNIICVY